MDREKFLVADMAWTSKRGKVNFAWVEAKIPVQFADAAEVPEQFYVTCQWRKKGRNVPEMWTFGLLYQGNHLYAIHVHPLSIHKNSVGRGRPFYGQTIDGIHEHTWSKEGDGYAEPINVPLDKPDVVWQMFLSRAKIGSGDFFHPDHNQRELDL